MRIAIYIHPEADAAHTNVHVLPRVGESLLWHDKLYRVAAVVHPTEDVSGKGIHVPNLYVREHSL